MVVTTGSLPVLSSTVHQAGLHCSGWYDFNMAGCQSAGDRHGRAYMTVPCLAVAQLCVSMLSQLC